MEEKQGCERPLHNRVSLTTPNSPSLDKDAICQERHDLSKARRKLLSLSRQSLDILGRPMDAMEYLSHSWNPAPPDFLHTFSSHNLSFPLADNYLEPSNNHGAEDNEQKLEMKEIIQTIFSSNNFVGNFGSVERKWYNSQNDKISINGVISIKLRLRNWLRGEAGINFQKWCKGRRKDELRLHTANIDAALSFTRLAAAIASVTGENDLNRGKNDSEIACGNNTNNVVSCAATLVAAACAEAAQSAGAPRDLVASALNSGFATQTPADMITLTVKAATCLRGATALRSRAAVGCRSQDAQELLNSRTPVMVVLPTGKFKHRAVSVQIRKARLILMVARKYLGTSLTSKQYTIVNVEEEARGHWCLALKTDGGDMKLLFEEENQLRMWTSTVFEFLHARDVGVAGDQGRRKMCGLIDT